MSESIDIAGRAFPIWPNSQVVKTYGELDWPLFRTRFKDEGDYRAALTQEVLRRAAQAKAQGHRDGALGGTKIYEFETWDHPAAQLICERAKLFFRKISKEAEAYIDLAWVNVYESGDYIMPHSHLRAALSLVYFLESGSDTQGESNNGRFCLVDPRFGPCCQFKPGYMTNPFRPNMRAGTMVAFPGALVHAVNPYIGEEPRISIAFNINPKKLPGNPMRRVRAQG